VLDAAQAERDWNWKPTMDRWSILEEIAQFAEQNPQWMEIAGN
jgi:hypothetical protein